MEDTLINKRQTYTREQIVILRPTLLELLPREFQEFLETRGGALRSAGKSTRRCAVNLNLKSLKNFERFYFFQHIKPKKEIHFFFFLLNSSNNDN